MTTMTDYKDRIQRRAEEKARLEARSKDVEVRNLHQLRTAIRPFSSKGNDSSRELLVKGFNEIKEALDSYVEQEDEHKRLHDEYGGFLPAHMPSPDLGRTWVDSIVERRLGGKRVSLKVRWELKDGTYEWDPITEELVECSGKSSSSD